MKKPISTLKLLAAGNTSISAATAWYLSDLGEFRGKQERGSDLRTIAK